jgi:hypothetical protein
VKETITIMPCLEKAKDFFYKLDWYKTLASEHFFTYKWVAPNKRVSFFLSEKRAAGVAEI